jgi:23S rRNA pseudouridine955/2504/2580 synthase
VSVQKVTVTAGEEGQRLDRWFRARFPQVTHGRLEKLLRKGEIRVNGGRVRANLRLEAGMVVRVPPLPAPEHAASPSRVSQSDVVALRDRILYRDDVLIVIDKPAGLAVQGGSGTTRHLDGMLDTLQFDAPDRPRLVHRLDRDTSGVLILARTRSAATVLTVAFANRAAKKSYWALVQGSPEADEGRLDSSLSKVSSGGGREQMASAPGGKPATTIYQIMARSAEPFTWLELTPLTGRTHQLRVQTAEADFPIVGDPRYGRGEINSPNITLGRGLHLHARELAIPHPEGGTLRVVAPLPLHMAQSWRSLGWDEPSATPPQRKP